MKSENDKVLSSELYNPFDPQFSGERRRNVCTKDCFCQSRKSGTVAAVVSHPSLLFVDQTCMSRSESSKGKWSEEQGVSSCEGQA